MKSFIHNYFNEIEYKNFIPQTNSYPINDIGTTGASFFQQIPFQNIPQYFTPGLDGRELNYINTYNLATYGQPYPHQKTQ